LTRRLYEHHHHIFKGSFTSRASDWDLKLNLSFDNILNARKAEQFIKKMNSKKFIEKLLLDHRWFLEKFND
jgi:putative endonuclease